MKPSIADWLKIAAVCAATGALWQKVDTIGVRIEKLETKLDPLLERVVRLEAGGRLTQSTNGVKQ